MLNEGIEKMPKVSVIMPVYNSSQFIAEAIESAINQTYKDLEIIVIDDGSTDSTSAIVGKYVKQYSGRVRYFYQSNCGPAAARNRGIKEAGGEYMAFLDSDDIWLPEKSELQISRLETDPKCGLVHTKRVRIGLDGETLLTRHGEPLEGHVFDRLLKENSICSSSVMIRKSCLDAAGLFNEDRNNRSEDYDIWLRIAHKYQLGFIDQILVKYRVNPDGYNRSNIASAYKSEIGVFLKAVELYEGDKEILIKERLHRSMLRMGDSFFYAKEYKEAAEAFLGALKYKKTDIKAIKCYLASKVMGGLKACQYA